MCTPSYTLLQPTLVCSVLFEAFDSTGQGKALSTLDFLCAMAVITRGTMEQRLRLIHQIYDVQRTGYLNMPDVSKILGAVHGRDPQVHRRFGLVMDKLFDDVRR